MAKKDEEIKKNEEVEQVESKPLTTPEEPQNEVESLKQQLKQSNTLLEKALSMMANFGKTKSDPEKEFENADKGVVDWNPRKEPNEYLKERISFRAFKDNDKYKEDIQVGINGYNYVIKRGKTVQIPRFVYLAIEQSEKQLAHAVDYSQGLADKFSEKTRQYNITE